jgi:hypothetical protein
MFECLKSGKVCGKFEIIYFVPSSFFAFHFYSIFKQESVANSQKRKNPQHLRVAGLQIHIVAILSILTHAEFYEPPPILVEQECISRPYPNRVSDSASASFQAGSPALIFDFIDIIFAAILQQNTKRLDRAISVNLSEDRNIFFFDFLLDLALISL